MLFITRYKNIINSILFGQPALLISILIINAAYNTALANNLTAKHLNEQSMVEGLTIDDRSSGNLKSNIGTEWRLVSDSVMGGLSSGSLTLENHRGRNCLRMRADVSTENNGGFVQMALSLSKNGVFDASSYNGVEIEVSGNDEPYNVHFRTDELWFPWQSYRAEFNTAADWQSVRIPFASLEPYKTSEVFSSNKLIRIGLVAIGRDFTADLCLASIRFYANRNTDATATEF